MGRIRDLLASATRVGSARRLEDSNLGSRSPFLSPPLCLSPPRVNLRDVTRDRVSLPDFLCPPSPPRPPARRLYIKNHDQATRRDRGPGAGFPRAFPRQSLLLSFESASSVFRAARDKEAGPRTKEPPFFSYVEHVSIRLYSE